ncbi:MAG: PilN domain-containing protein [Syntrophales bacterium]
MIKINLLPYREKKKREGLKREMIILSACAAMVVVALISLQTYMLWSTSVLEQQVKDAENRLIGLTRSAGEIDRVKNDKLILERKLAIINSLEANRLKPVLILDALTTLLPAGQLWITNLTANETDLRIDGMARDNSAVARFMKTLETSVYIQSVDLISSKQQIIAHTKLQAFTLSCVLKKA